MNTLPVRAEPDRQLVAEIAMDIGKEAVSHLRVMYPKAYEALGPSGQTSLRNKVHNEIMAALDTIDADEIRRRLELRKARRRKMHKIVESWSASNPSQQESQPRSTLESNEMQ